MDAAASNPATASPLLAGLFPAGVYAAQLCDLGAPECLLPDEAAQIERAAPSRKREFAAGRACARLAMAQLGVHEFALRNAADRQPLWPDGVVGSITHTTGYCGTVVGPGTRFLGLGLDTELATAVQEHLWTKICTGEELERLRGLSAASRVAAAALIFSAKEAFYKAQYPVTGERLNFIDVSVEAQPGARDDGQFAIRPQRALLLDRHDWHAARGRFRYHGGYVTAGLALVRLLVAEDLQGRHE